MTQCVPRGDGVYESKKICEYRVNFNNVKPQYGIDEDIAIDYTLKKEFKSSTRDWVGIFPKNWTSLQQYLTFEYTLSAPPNAINLLNRTIIFPRIFHREALLNLEYQLVYVSKDIQIMATSSYFYFTKSPVDNKALKCPWRSYVTPTLKVSNVTFNAANTSKLMLYDPSQTKEEKLTFPELSANSSAPQALRQICRYCHRQICGLKIDALRGDFLATLSDSLVNRINRLERDLNFAETALKNVKGTRENIGKRLQAYEAFVAEMLSSIAVRGIVKITNDKGQEILLRRINEVDRLSEVDAKANNGLENEIVTLKSLLQEQQKTIAELTEKIKLNVPSRDQINYIDRGVQTMSVPLQEPNILQQTENDNLNKNREECKEKVFV